MSFGHRYYHIVWLTKFRNPHLKQPHRRELLRHIWANRKLKGARILAINGWTDHVHILLLTNPSAVLIDIVHQIKGESSYWAKNKYAKLPNDFQWQRGFHVETISPENIDAVLSYIKKQESHHENQSIEEELSAFSGTRASIQSVYSLTSDI